ncbi:MAG: hypothetical protein HFG26_05720 [Provencibacterium sp.]|jgi:hypothetical protein|nr:hypothetical protein [Provencibacterium sp.]
MELLWIIFVTALALTAAYYAGGYLDRRTRERQEEEDKTRRAEYLEQMAGFARGFAELLVRRGLAERGAVPEIACALSRYTAGYSEESYTGEEWRQLEAALRAPAD